MPCIVGVYPCRAGAEAGGNIGNELHHHFQYEDLPSGSRRLCPFRTLTGYFNRAVSPEPALVGFDRSDAYFVNPLFGASTGPTSKARSI